MKKETRRIIYLMLLLLLHIVCFNSVAAAADKMPILSIEQYPRIDGSTSTQPLATLVACRITSTAFGWGTIKTNDRTRTLYPVIDQYEPDRRLSFQEEMPKRLGPPSNINLPLWRKIAHSDTHSSYVNLINREVELILSSREPSDDEKLLAQQKGVKILSLSIALDAFVFIVNSRNPVPSISIEQARDIYSGKITNWEELGSASGKITLFRRSENSASEEKMKKLVMRGVPMTATRQTHLEVSMIGPFNALRTFSQGIGYTFYYYERFMARTPGVKIVALNNVMPDEDTVKNHTYPLVTEVVVSYLSDLPRQGNAAKIRDWLVTPRGQQVVAESGYVPITK